MNKKNLVWKVLGAAVVLFLLIQLIPFGHNHTNPSMVSEPKWSSPEARALVKEHCFQCHSNETEWPWYSNIAPGSWLIAFDVIAGRGEFNFSDWNNNPGELDEMVGAINEGEMPPIQYWLFHPNSKMDAQQKSDLINALQSSLK
jgi:mono/diheme cytochrome c family protein